MTDPAQDVADPEAGEERASGLHTLLQCLTWLLPVVLFFLLLSAIVGKLKREDRMEAYMGEEAMADIAVAEHLADRQPYGLTDGERAPFLHNMLWRYSLAQMPGLGGQPASASVLLAAICAVGILLAVLAWARRMSRSQGMLYYVALLLILGPVLIRPTLSGTSGALSMALVTWACLQYIRRVAPRRDGVAKRPARRGRLPVSAAFLIGLAAWVHLEFLIVWFVLALHAFLARSWTPSRDDNKEGGTLNGFIGGTALMGVMLLPFFLYNLQVIRVPFARVPGAPMVSEMWASAPLDALFESVRLSVGALPEAFGLVGQIPFFDAPLARILVWAGLLALAARSISDAELRPFTLPLFLLVLVPVGFAIIYPYVGWGGAASLMSSLGPICVPAAAYGLLQLVGAQERVVAMYQGVTLPGWVYYVLPAALGVGLLYTSSATAVRQMRAQAARVGRQQLIQQDLTARLRDGSLDATLVVTDGAGWLGNVNGLRILDLSGEFSWRVLYCLTTEGGLDTEKIQAVLVDEKPDLFVLWDATMAMPDLGAPVVDVVSRERALRHGLPRIFKVTWPAAS